MRSLCAKTSTGHVLQWPAYVISVKLDLKNGSETPDTAFPLKPWSWEAAYFSSASFHLIEKFDGCTEIFWGAESSQAQDSDTQAEHEFSVKKLG